MAADHSHAGTGAIVVISVWERPEGLRDYELDQTKKSVAEETHQRILEQRTRVGTDTSVRKQTPPAQQKDLIQKDHPEFAVRYRNAAGASIVHSGYKIDYWKTRGRVSPFFDGLAQGKFLASYCVEHGVFAPPIATCRSCLDDISENWTDLAHVEGTVQTWTSMHYTGPSFRNDLPFHNVLVEFSAEKDLLVDAVSKIELKNPKISTSMMSRLVLPDFMTEKDIFAGMKVKSVFNLKNPTGRVTDMWFEPAFSKTDWETRIKPSVSEYQKASNSKAFWRGVFPQPG
jgi:uncharacterized OB-fold protein